MDEMVQEASVAGRQVGAVAKGGSNLHIHNLSQSELEHIGAGNHIANVGVGSIPLVVCSLPGCIPRRAGIWDPAAVGNHRW